jgi:hypothetical protein
MTRPTLGGLSARRAHSVRGRFVRRVLTVSLAAGSCVLASTLPATAQRGPAPTATPLPADVVSLACAPTLAYELPDVPLRISGGQESVVHTIHAPGDLVTINAGRRSGIAVGQEYYTRRPLVSRDGRVGSGNPATIRTSGWIRVWAVDEEMSLATISHACETVDVDDYLEPFVAPSVPLASNATSEPERGNYGLVLSGQDRRTQFGRGDYLLIDRGSNQGVTPGARFVVYHDKKTPGNFLFQIGEAVAMDVQGDTSTLYVLTAIDAIAAGDYVGMRK